MSKFSSALRRGNKKVTVLKKTRTNSSHQWLQRQVNDPYVQEAQRLGYRSRAAFKLIQIDERFNLMKPGDLIVDLGAAPGGWSQVAVKKAGKKRVVALDLLSMEEIEGVEFWQGDFSVKDLKSRFKEHLLSPISCVLSDMASATTGHTKTDHLRTLALAEEAFYFARDVLKAGGSFVVKFFQGGGEHELLKLIKLHFREVCYFKPEASRKESSEMYLVAKNFKGVVKSNAEG